MRVRFDPSPRIVPVKGSTNRVFSRAKLKVAAVEGRLLIVIAVGGVASTAATFAVSSTMGRRAADPGGGVTETPSAHEVICFWYISSTPVTDMMKTTMPAATPTQR